MKAIRCVAASLCAVLIASPVGATVLYKSVSPSGVLQFSDTPPDGKSTIIETRTISSSSAEAAGLVQVSQASQMNDTVDSDEALARAYAQVDFAEHSLALARRAMWSELDGLRIEGPRATQSDYERVEFYKRGVLAARQMLLEVLRNRPPMMLASR